MSVVIQDNKICLEGDWSTGGAAVLYPHLLQGLERLQGAEPVSPEMDLTGITGLDACGCQLLASFVCALNRHGIQPLSATIPEAVRRTISVLGFDRALEPLMSTSRGCP